MKNTKLVIMIEGAVIAAAAVALSLIPLNTGNADFDLSLGLIPLTVYALRRGLLPGIAAGFVWGLMRLLLPGAYILTLPQALLEYPVAFALGGFGGVFAGPLRRKLANPKGVQGAHRARVDKATVAIVIIAGASAAAARWFVHYWAGLLFWMDYMPEGVNPFLFNLIANGASAAVNAVMLAAALLVIVRTARGFFLVPEQRGAHSGVPEQSGAPEQRWRA